VRQVDAPVREVAGKVLGQRAPPLQQEGRGVVQGVEGAGVLLLPTELAQGAAPAHLFCRPVKDHRRVLLRGHRGRPAHAVVQGPQSGGHPGQLGAHPLQRGGKLRCLSPHHPLAAEGSARQHQKQDRSHR
ncbi:Manganese transport regulator, partial [Dysosmobacter welbionis]